MNTNTTLTPALRQAFDTALEANDIDTLFLLVKLDKNFASSEVDQLIIKAKAHALDLAVKENNMAKVLALIADPQVNPFRYNCDTVGYWACSRGHVEVVKLLLANPRFNPRTNGPFFIYWASCVCQLELVKLLLADPRIDLRENDARGGSILAVAASTGNIELMKLLLAHPRFNPSTNADFSAEDLKYAMKCLTRALVDTPKRETAMIDLLNERMLKLIVVEKKPENPSPTQGLVQLAINAPHSSSHQVLVTIDFNAKTYTVTTST